MTRLIDADALLRDNGLFDAVRYGNMNVEQRKRSFSTMRLYEIAEMVEMQPTVDAKPVNRAAILRLCNEIEGIMCEIYNTGYMMQNCDYDAILNRLKAIGKELTGDDKR